jgi:hypothetical protein
MGSALQVNGLPAGLTLLREEDVGGPFPMTQHGYTTISNNAIIVNVSIWDGTPVSFCDEESFERPLFASRR